jgi:hypothetical protein
MTSSRPTKARRVRDVVADDRCGWEAFRLRLESLQTLTQAVQLMREVPPASTPGRGYYTNLGFFLGAFTVPVGTSYAEKALYLGLVQRLTAAGELKPGGGGRIEESLRKAMAAQGHP